MDSLNGIIQFPGDCIPDFLKVIIQFSGYPGIGSFSTIYSGSSLRVFLVFYVSNCCFQIYWSHIYVVSYWVVFCDIIRQFLISLLRGYVEMILSYSVLYPIKSHFYFSEYVFSVPCTVIFSDVLTFANDIGGCEWLNSTKSGRMDVAF